MYNLTAAKKWFVKVHSFLAKDLNYDEETSPTEKQINCWRTNVMEVCAQHKAAHEEIEQLEKEAEKSKEAFYLLTNYISMDEGEDIRNSASKISEEIEQLRAENKITFKLFKSACKFTGENDWKDGNNCNHPDFTFMGELEEDGYLIRSNQPCTINECPYLKEHEKDNEHTI